MFDAVTASQIAAAPELSGINPRDVPALITEAFVQVAVANSLLDEEEIENAHVFDELRSIAAAQEAIALILEPGELRSSAAYVAASAYQVLVRAFPEENDASRALLEPHRISARLSSLLLYIVADAPADAAEVASELPKAPSQPHSNLIDALRALGSGDAKGIGAEDHDQDVTEHRGPSEIAAAFGYSRCSGRVVELLQFLRRPANTDWHPGGFRAIARSMEFDFTVGTDSRPARARSVVLGPWQLARLLEMAEPVLLESSIAAVRAPDGVQGEGWAHVVGRLSRRRPLLWQNHRHAIERGLLESGRSAVVTFPTGAGKSTVSELKIAATVLRGLNVVCLVPTLSLIDQFGNAVRSAIPGARVTAQRDLDERIQAYEGDEPEVFVMTPESCLAALGADSDRLGNVGLIVFDEAHLMHMDGEEPSRRALDASLCFLTLGERFRGADLLLISAMLSNAAEIAEWLAATTGRDALALDSAWKPTRQARGAVVYMRDEIDRLRGIVQDSYDGSTNQTPPVSLRRQMQAHPYGFFGLRSTWSSMRRRDYKLTRLLQDSVTLTVGGHRGKNRAWWLNPNANKVAADLAAASASAGLKTLVFTQQVSWTASISRDISAAAPGSTRLNAAERLLLERAVEALGDPSALYIDVLDGVVRGSALTHHGLLLPEERRLHESLYKRSDGVPVLVATSTVSQGMNFPSELVIIAGDKRFDAATNERTQLQAHELLNAAGRAGRAGAKSNGMVLVIPGEVVTYNGRKRMDQGWFVLKAAFSNSDQCVELKDPLASVLDDLGSEQPSPLSAYLVRRLGTVGETKHGHSLVRRSFAAHLASKRGEDEWIESRLSVLQRMLDVDMSEAWVKQAAALTGLPTVAISSLGKEVRLALPQRRDITQWRDWLLSVMRAQPDLVERVLRDGSRAALSAKLEDLGDWNLAALTGRRLVDEISVLLEKWMSGATLREIQEVGMSRGIAKTDAKLEFARKFMLRVLPDLAYLFGLPSLIQRQMAAVEQSDQLPEQHPLLLLQRCVESGVDTAEKLFYLEANPMTTRAQAHLIQ